MPPKTTATKTNVQRRREAAVPLLINSAATAGATAIDPNGPMPVVLDLRVTPEALVNVAATEKQEQLMEERNRIEGQLRKASETHEKNVKQLAVHAQKVIDDYALDNSTKKTVEAISEFTGKQHVARLFNVDWSRYSSRSDKTTDPEVDITRLSITGKVCIFESREDQQYENSESIVEKRVTLKFSDAMKADVTTIEDSARKVRDVQDSLNNIKRLLADMPRFRNRAAAEITKAALRGQLTDGKALLDAVMGTPSKALPAGASEASIDE